MKQLGDLSPDIQAQLKRIGEKLESLEDDDPFRCAYTCHRCSDTGFSVEERNGMKFGTACRHCLSGQEVARQEAATLSKRSEFRQKRIQQRKGNRLVLLDVPMDDDEKSDEWPR